MNSERTENFWRNRAARLARQLNAAWWLECFNRLLIGGAFVIVIAILVARTERAPWLTPGLLGWSLTALFTIFGIIAWHWSKSRFVSVETGLVRLDVKLSLAGRLVSANAGIGSWPTLLEGEIGIEAGRASFQWNRLRSSGPIFLTILSLAAAWWIPIERSVSAPPISAAPAAWDRMEEWLADLKEEELIDPETVQEFTEKVEELRSQPEKEWFSHSSLEATDTLQQSLVEEIQALSSGLSHMERNIAAMQESDSSSTTSERGAVREEFEKSLGELKGNSLVSEKSLLERLQNIDPSTLSKSGDSMSTAEVEALRKQLSQAASALGSLEGLPSSDGSSQLGQTGDQSTDASSPGMELGTGDPSRGPGAAPLTLGEKETHFDVDGITPVQSEDLSRATLGDTLGQAGTSKRKIEKIPITPSQGGKASTGTGGQVIRQERLLPEEQALLKRWFR